MYGNSFPLPSGANSPTVTRRRSDNIAVLQNFKQVRSQGEKLNVFDKTRPRSFATAAAATASANKSNNSWARNAYAAKGKKVAGGATSKVAVLGIGIGVITVVGVAGYILAGGGGKKKK